jgi:hypothetical protein
MVAVVSCPNCPTALRIPDGVSGSVKCPKCNALFAVSFPNNQNISVSQNTAPLPTANGTVSKNTQLDQDFEAVDEPRASKRVSARIEVEKDDDRPSRKKKQSRSEDYEDDDEWDGSPSYKRGHRNARVGMIMVTIASWMYFSLYVLFTICVLLILVGVVFASDTPTPRPRSSAFSGRHNSDLATAIEIILMFVGFIGLGNWIISLVGFAFCIAGPARVRTTAITTTTIAGVHLMLICLAYSISPNMLAGIGRYNTSMSSSSWIIFATTLPYLNSFLPMLVYGARQINGEYLVLIATGVCEVIRLIFSLLTIRGLANESKNHAAAERAQLGVVGSGIFVGGGMVLMLLVILMVVEARFNNVRASVSVGLAALLLLCVAYSVMLILPAIAAGSTQRSLAQRNY